MADKTSPRNGIGIEKRRRRSEYHARERAGYHAGDNNYNYYNTEYKAEYRSGRSIKYNSRRGTGNNYSRRGRRVRRSRSAKFFLILFLMIVVAGFFYRAAVTASMSDIPTVPEEDWSRVIAYIPLDDRIDNYEDAIYLAEASGWRLVMPEKDLFRTALDGQELNANGTPYGNREALIEWIQEMDERGCDYFIISLDQIFSGGLVNSRSVSASQNLTFSDGNRGV